MVDYTLIGMITGAVVLVGILIGLIVYFTSGNKPDPTKNKKAKDCMNLFINKLKSFAKTTKEVDTHSITGEITDYNHFCQAIDAGIAVNCPGLEVTMALYNLHQNYYENLRPEPVNYQEGEQIKFINKNGTLKPPDDYKLLNCRGIPRDTVFRFVLKHNDVEEDVAFEISIPDFMGKVMKA